MNAHVSSLYSVGKSCLLMGALNIYYNTTITSLCEHNIALSLGWQMCVESQETELIILKQFKEIVKNDIFIQNTLLETPLLIIRKEKKIIIELHM